MTRKLMRVTRKEGGCASQPCFGIGSIFQQTPSLSYLPLPSTQVIRLVGLCVRECWNMLPMLKHGWLAHLPSLCVTRISLYITSLLKDHPKYPVASSKTMQALSNWQITPRTKHIAIPYHHFRHHVNAGTIMIEKVATQENLADIFTKPLPLVTFRYLRRKLLGW